VELGVDEGAEDTIENGFRDSNENSTSLSPQQMRIYMDDKKYKNTGRAVQFPTAKNDLREVASTVDFSDQDLEENKQD
jgi:hypothetical protein